MRPKTTVRFFCRRPEHRSCHAISRQMKIPMLVATKKITFCIMAWDKMNVPTVRLIVGYQE